MDSTSNVTGTLIYYSNRWNNNLLWRLQNSYFYIRWIYNLYCTGSPANNNVDYLVVSWWWWWWNWIHGGGGGGAGGFRESKSTVLQVVTASPLANPTSLPVSVTSYPITVGAGGAGSTRYSCPSVQVLMVQIQYFQL
jgi:hypothetical protein